MGARTSEDKHFTQGEWDVWITDHGYVFAGPDGFSAIYPGPCAEYIDRLILFLDPKPIGRRWQDRVVSALFMRMPHNLVREVERHVRANWEWED